MEYKEYFNSLWKSAKDLACNRVCFSDASILRDPEADMFYEMIAGVPHEKEISQKRSYFLHLDNICAESGLNYL